LDALLTLLFPLMRTAHFDVPGILLALAAPVQTRSWDAFIIEVLAAIAVLGAVLTLVLRRRQQ
jgi:hypothetical protein